MKDMKIAIIVAMEKEFRLLREQIENAEATGDMVRGRIGSHKVVLQHCGIGKVNAAIGATELVHDEHPDLVMSTGVAGGASTDLHPGDLVVGTEYTYHDVYCGSECAFGQVMGQPARFSTPADLVEKALSVKSETRMKAGLMVSGDWFVDSREKMQSILNHFPDAVAVDMESTAIAQTCHRLGCPFISFRVVSDVPLTDQKASQYYDFWDRAAKESFECTKNFIESL